jgi:hypothetical protein
MSVSAAIAINDTAAYTIRRRRGISKNAALFALNAPIASASGTWW